MKKTDTLPATLSALIQEYSIAEGIQMAEQQVRENPAKALCRHSLFQLLCVAGDWSRALHQLQLCARMEANYTQEARLYRELVRCEMFRHTVFQGEQRPGFLLPQPVWVESLLAALACHDDTGEVDKHRNTALEAITDTGGQWNGGAFDWASDSDSRLGPVLELVTGGVYIWLPFSQIRSLESPQPTRLTDLLWKPVNITLVNGDTHGAWLFTRYSGSESASDALRLCRNRLAGRPRRNHRAGAGAESVADQPRRYQPAGHGPLYLSCSGKRWRMSTSRFTPANHLLPTLFDRLCDNAPYQKIDRDISVTPVQLKEIIRRDLSFLLNTISHEGDIDARRYPQAAASVLNYGLPPLAGSFMYEHKWDDISEAIRRAIIRFEPRLNAATLRVTPLLDKTRQGSYNTLQFEIRGQILTQPYPTEFLVRSALDMELSRITFF